MHGRSALSAHDARVIGVRSVYPFGKRAGAATEIALPRFLKQPPYIRSALATASAARSAARTRIRCAASWTSRSIVLVWKVVSRVSSRRLLMFARCAHMIVEGPPSAPGPVFDRKRVGWGKRGE